MLTVVRRGAATREKPPEVARGAASRLPWAWDGLCFAVPFNDATRDAARDLVTGAAPSEWGGSPTWTRDNRGNTALLLNNSSWIGYADNPAHNKPVTAITAYVRLRREGTLSSTPGGIFAKVAAVPDTYPWTTWGVQTMDTDATGLGASIRVDAEIYYFENTSFHTDTSTWISVFLRWTSGGLQIQDVLGERGQTLTSQWYPTAISGSLGYNAGFPIRINAMHNTAEPYNAAYSQAMLWSRRLTDVEIQALVADPYGWYSPRRETVGLSSPYPVVFGAGEMKHGTGSGGLR